MLALLLALVLAVCWTVVVLYSRRTYYRDGCGRCGTTGKDWEPLWMALCRFTPKRRWRPCPDCDGAGSFDIRERK